MTQQGQRSRARVFVLAFGASLAVHALLVLLLPREPLPAPPTHQAMPLELIILEPPRASAPRPPPPAALLPPRPRPVRRPPPVATTPSPPAAQPPTQVPPVEPPPVRAPLVSDVPYLNPPMAQRPTVLPVTPDTAPRPSKPPEEAVGLQAPTQRSPDGVILDTVDDALVLARQGRVQVHPYFHDLGQALFNAWHPEPAVEEVSPQVLVQRERPKVQGFIDAWRKRAEVYGRTGSPLSDMKVPRPPPVQGPLDAAPHFAPQVAMGGQMDRDVKEQRRALFRLTQDRRGRLVELHLVKPSSHPEMDRAAMDDFRKVGDTLPAPPEELLGSKPSLVSLWAMELVRGYDTRFPDTSTHFAAALAPGVQGSRASWFKHLWLEPPP